jgi:nitrogen regulatory protein P-II 1
MKLITAVVQPDKMDDVTRAACGAGARGLTATNVVGFGQQYGHMGQAQPADPRVLVLPKLRIDVLVSDEMAEPVAAAIAGAVKTGAIGDGKTWTCPVDSALRFRTGERNDDAL